METRITTEDQKVTGEIFNDGYWRELISFSYHPWRGDWGTDLSTCLPTNYFLAKTYVELFSDVIKEVDLNRTLMNLVGTLESYGELFINGSDCKMSCWEENPGEEYPYLTDDNRAFSSEKSAVKYMLKTVGDVIGWDQNEYEYDLNSEESA